MIEHLPKNTEVFSGLEKQKKEISLIDSEDKEKINKSVWVLEWKSKMGWGDVEAVLFRERLMITN